MINCISFGSTLIYSHKEFLNLRPPRIKLNLRSPCTHTQNSAGARNPQGLTRPAQDSNTYCSVFWQQGCQPVFTKNSQTLSPKKPDSSFKTLLHKICITKHKRDFKTHQKYRYSAIPLFESIFFPHKSTVIHLFLNNKIVHY